MPLPRRLLAGAIALGLTLGLAACTATTSGTGQPAFDGSAPGMTFRDCTRQAEASGLSAPSGMAGRIEVGCGRLSVPLDYGDPAKGTITIAVERIHDVDDTTPTGSLLTNPGGPGASGIEFVNGFLSELPASIVKSFDVIGFDPRGVGESSPVTCVTNAQKDTMLAESPDVTTTAGFAAAKQAAKDFAEDCSRKYGSRLPYYNTVDTARDMDRIRAALGDARTTYLGFSYGTELGWVYAHLFPTHVRALVLDGAVDPDTDGIASFAQQLQGFEDAFDQFAASCRTQSPCDELGDPRASVEKVLDATKTTPLETGSDRELTYSLAVTGVLQALYSQSLWSHLGDAILSAENGDGSELLALADLYNERSSSGTYTNVIDANTTIGCNDSTAGPSDAEIRSTAASWVKRFPIFGLSSAAALFGCQSWQPDRTPVPKPNAATPTKVLVLGNLHDPATPYQGAKDLTRDLGNAELLSWDGEGHTSYLQGSSCIDAYVNAYLLSLTLPPTRRTCPA